MKHSGVQCDVYTLGNGNRLHHSNGAHCEQRRKGKAKATTIVKWSQQDAETEVKKISTHYVYSLKGSKMIHGFFPTKGRLLNKRNTRNRGT